MDSTFDFKIKTGTIIYKAMQETQEQYIVEMITTEDQRKYLHLYKYKNSQTRNILITWMAFNLSCSNLARINFVFKQHFGPH